MLEFHRLQEAIRRRKDLGLPPAFLFGAPMSDQLVKEDNFHPTERFRDMGDGTSAEVVASVPLTRDSTRAFSFNLDSLPQALAYNADGTLNTVTAGPDQNGNLYVQTMSYTNGVLTGVSAWVKQ